MIKTVFDNVDVRIRFHYTTYGGPIVSNDASDVLLKEHYGKRHLCVDKFVRTTCSITEKNISDTSQSISQIGVGCSMKVPSDKLDKDLGRRRALARALKNCSPEYRKHIWDAYNDATEGKSQKDEPITQAKEVSNISHHVMQKEGPGVADKEVVSTKTW